MKRWIVTICLAGAVVFVAAGSAAADTVDWKGVTWTLDNVTAAVNPDGSITLTSLVTHSFIAGLHANRLDGTFENVMDPWIIWSFTGHKGDILIDKEEVVKPGNPSVQAGSLWGYKWAVTKYTEVGGSRPEQYFIWSTETTSPISHVVNIGKRTDGTVDAKFDTEASSASTFLKTNIGGAWGFQDVYLRMRDANIGDTITFNDFQYGSVHAPWDVWVDDAGDDSNPGTESEPFATIQKGIDTVAGGGTVYVAGGTYNEGLIDIDKSLTIKGDVNDKPLILPTEDTDHATHRGWFQIIGSGTVANFENLQFDGAGQSIENCIRYQEGPTGNVENCDFSDIYWNKYTGIAVCYVDYTAWGGGSALDIDPDGLVKDCTFNGIQRIGISIFGVDKVTVQDCIYTGKGDGDWLDYAIEIGGGGVATISENLITGCTGVASSDGSTSAGILATTYYGAGTEGAVTGNTIMGCTTAIAVGYDGSDTTVLSANYNNMVANDGGIGNVSSNAVDAENNWWGHASGPYDPDGLDETDGVTCYDPSAMANADGLGGDVSDGNVDYCPWLTSPYGDNILALMATDASLYITPAENAIIDMDVYNLIQKVLGCQAMLNFDSTYFATGPSDVDVQPGGGPWDEVIYDVWDTGGDLDVAVGVEVNVSGPSSGTDADGMVAKITLTPTGVEGITQMVFRADVPDDETQQTMLSDVNSVVVWPTKLDSQTIVIDGTDPVVTNLAATQDQGAGAVNVLACAVTTLQGTVSITVDANDVLAGLAGVPAIDVRHSDGVTILAATLEDGVGPTFGWTVTVGSATKNGTYTITVTATDKAGNDADITGTLCVNKNQVTGSIELDSLNPPASGITRAVTFVATGGVQKAWDVDLVFGAGVDTVAFTLTNVPDGSTHLSAKTAWNLRRKVALGGGGENQWTADLTAGNKLLGGDLNGSNAINILDFAVLRTHWYTTDPTADINGNGEVNLTDFGILRTNWFLRGDLQ